MPNSRVSQSKTSLSALTPGVTFGANELRTAAGPANAPQCVLSGGPYTTASQVRQCQEGRREWVR
jgi:hypothetical protein